VNEKVSYGALYERSNKIINSSFHSFALFKNKEDHWESLGTLRGAFVHASEIQSIEAPIGVQRLQTGISTLSFIFPNIKNPVRIHHQKRALITKRTAELVA
jgi:hypothetical protein